MLPGEAARSLRGCCGAGADGRRPHVTYSGTGGRVVRYSCRGAALKLEQARYEAERARRQYDAAEPENRLVAAELERRWNRALEVVAEVEREWVAFEAGERQKGERIDRAALLRLAEDLPGVWHDPKSDMRLKKRIVRALIEQVVPYAPWTIRAADLQEPAVQEYVRRIHARGKAPRTPDPGQLTIDSAITWKGGAVCHCLARDT